MKDNKLSKLGGTCAILQAVLYLVVVVTFFLLPPEQRQITGIYTNPGGLLESYAKNPIPLTVIFSAEALSFLFGVAVVLAISESVRSTNEGLVRWTSTLALLGIMLTTIDDLRSLALFPSKAVAYVQGDAVVKSALAVPGALEGLDPQHWLRLGAFGLWVMVVSILALRSGSWPKTLAYVGISTAITNWLVVIADVFPSLSVLTIIAGVAGIILVPVWLIWLGVRLRRVI